MHAENALERLGDVLGVRVVQANRLLADRPARGQLVELLLGAPGLDDLLARVGLEPQLAPPAP